MNVNEDGLFRDGLVGPSMSVVIGVAIVLGGRGHRARPLDAVARALGVGLLVFGALWLLGFLDATYLAGPFHFGRNGGAVAYWVFVIGVGAVIAGVVHARRRADDRSIAVLVGLGTVVALHLVDLVTGAHLEWNTVFGYSPTIGIRFVGQGNMTFSQLTAAAVLFAGLLAWQVPTRRGVRVAIALLAVTRDRDGRAVLGQRLRWRGLGRARVRAARRGCSSVTSCGGARCGCSSGCSWPPALVVGVVDLLRPSDQRTHVGKFFEKAGTDFGSATLVLRRKASENLSALGPLAPALLPRRARRARGSTSGGCDRGRCARCSHACRRRAPPRSRSRSWRCSASRSTTPASPSPA